ncbi:VOC family protein [Bordetella sp. BOR01]|uniref:bleomycin resistance protein n=1 Tax=Bordetella sp. BOR01 TaxID=2854779 RepID=UPI001C44460E|nr:VOC family protein [Bordetella sp. BOR01]MBV7486533.1 VOC family protein [Bordetella sp. BOR01]
MLVRNKMVPELYVAHLDRSLDFWVGCLAFAVAYQRPQEKFVYLDKDGVQVMLAELGAVPRQWLTAPMEPPFGRGINLQIEVDDVAPMLERLRLAEYPLFRDCQDTWYQSGTVENGVREFLVLDPDGYLVRLGQPLGERPCKMPA